MKKIIKIILSTFIIFASISIYVVHGEDNDLEGKGTNDDPYLISSKEGDFALAARAFVLAGMLVAGVALSNAANQIGLVEGTRVTIGRDIGSVLGDPNDLSLVLLFPLSFAIALVLTPRTGLPSRG